MIKKLEELETDLIETKFNLAETFNIILEHGGKELVDLI